MSKTGNDIGDRSSEWFNHASVVDMTVDNYDEFLVERRKLMASMIEKYYKSI